jgi:ankyrin repeat protein
VRILLERGAEVGETAPLEAAENGHEMVTTMLLQKGVNVNARDRDGRTALHLAADEGHEMVVRLLPGNGADVSAEDERGWTAERMTTGEFLSYGDPDLLIS